MKARYLIDKSALARMTHEVVRSRLAPIIEAGEAVSCAVVELEVLYSARSHGDYIKIRDRRRLAYDHVAITEAVLERALDVQQELAKSGHHRVPIPDLIIAATAESAALIVLHYDKDFETIAGVTGQPVEWVAEPGSVP